MRLFSNLFSTLFPSLEGGASLLGREREIDASMRLAVLGFIKASVFWLLISSLLGLISSIKLHAPSYMDEYAFLTYGKVYPAFWNTLVYGWLINAGLGCVTWILARLSGRVVGSALLTVAGIAWNIAVVIGLVGIFVGDQNPYRMLEFPFYSMPFLLLSFIGIGLWVCLAFRARAFRSSFASQWYVLAAAFSFVWIYTAAYIMLSAQPAQGVFQPLVAAWFRGNLFGLVIAPLALATIYYLIPKALGQHIVGYRQSSIAFWSWIAFTSCSGLASLVHGPFPAWVASIGVVASIALLLPISVFSMQFLSSLFAQFSRIWDTISIRYVLFAVIAFIVASFLIIFGSLRDVQATIQFSQFDDGARFLFLAGFAGMVFMGGAYFILPRILNKELPSTGLADVQFWIQGLGIFVITVSLVMGGIAHGSLINGSTVDTVAALKVSSAYLFLSTMGFFIFLCGNLAFVVSFSWMLLSSRTDKEKSADLIRPASELEYTPS